MLFVSITFYPCLYFRGNTDAYTKHNTPKYPVSESRRIIYCFSLYRNIIAKYSLLLHIFSLCSCLFTYDTVVYAYVGTQECGTVVAVGISGVVCIVISRTVGTLFGVLLSHLITRQWCRSQSQSQTQKPPMYEDVENITCTPTASSDMELKSNEAYHPLRKQHIPTTGTY